MDTEDIVGHRQPSAPWRWSLIVSVVVLNFFLPSLVLCYGVVLVASVGQGAALWVSLACPTTMTLTFYMTQCWCRDAADSWGGDRGYRVMSALGLLMLSAGVAACAFVPHLYHPILYGVLGGAGSSLISAQVDAVIFDSYDSRIGVIRGLCFSGQAMGQFVLPHIILLIIEEYELYMFYLVLSALMLQTLPAILFLRTVTYLPKSAAHSRYCDLEKSYSFYNSSTSYSSNELQLTDLSRKCWQSPSGDNLHRDYESELDCAVEDSENNATTTPPPSPEEKRRNMFGVEILPEIPEESESSCSDDSDSDSGVGTNTRRHKRRFSSAIKRFSAMSDSLDGYIAKQSRRDSSFDFDENDNGFSDIDVTYTNVSPTKEVNHEKITRSLSYRCNSAYTSFKRRMCLPSYKIYKIKRRTLYVLYAFNDTFIKPLTRSLSCWRFYPALLLSVAKLNLTVLSSSLIPIFTVTTFPEIPLIENNFLMSLHSFTWLCFLLGTPWVAYWPKGTYKYIAVSGIFVSTLGILVIAESTSYDALAIGCVVAGFGYGALTSTWEATAQEFVGARKWPKIHSTLETLSAVCLTLFVVGLCYLAPAVQGLKLCLIVLAGTQAIVFVIWFVIVIVKFYKSKVRTYRLTESFW